jgi:biuret amidohydrolase
MVGSTALSSPTRPLAELIAPARTALIVIDVQRDFAAPDGVMGLLGVDLSAVDPAVDNMRALCDVARRAGTLVIFVRSSTGEETDSRAAVEWRARRGFGPSARPCRENTPGCDYYRIAPQHGDIEIVKYRYSSFVGTRLDLVLKARPTIDTLVPIGLTTECCVETTARDAFARDYHVFLAHDACAAYRPDWHTVSLSVLSQYFATITATEQILQAWDSAAHMGSLVGHAAEID